MSDAIVVARDISTRRFRPGALLFALLALWALAYDGFVVRTHVHLVRGVAAVGDGDRQSTLAIVDAECALCDASVTFEPLLPAATGMLVPRQVQTAATIVVPGAYRRFASRAHIWRSRAPPGPVSLS